MFHLRFPRPLRLLPAVLTVLAAPAWAGPEGPPRKADPLDASVAVPPVLHESVIGLNRLQREAPPKSWKEANDNVGRIGGWRSYAREASRAEAPGSPASVAAPAASAPATELARPVPPPSPGHHGAHKSN